jgi:hypothetical protein
MVISVDTYQRIDLDLSGTGGITQEYSLNNNLSYTNSLYIYLYLNSSDINANIIVTLNEYESNGNSLINTETFTLTNNNKLLNRLNNLTTEYTLISIDYNTYNGQLNGYLEKNIIGDISGNTIIPVDISGQRVDISGQTVIVSGITLDASGLLIDISGQNINDFRLQSISQNINNGIEYSNIKLNSIDNYSSSILNNAILTNTKLGYNAYDNDRLKIYDASSNTLLTTINKGIGANIGVFAFGNFLSNVTIIGGGSSSTLTFTSGDYGRKTMLIYRDNETSNTDSISFYSNTTSGVATNILLAIVYPIVDNGYRWSNVIVNLLPFTSILVKNNSASSISGVYLTVTNA